MDSPQVPQPSLLSDIAAADRQWHRQHCPPGFANLAANIQAVYRRMVRAIGKDHPSCSTRIGGLSVEQSLLQPDHAIKQDVIEHRVFVIKSRPCSNYCLTILERIPGKSQLRSKVLVRLVST